MGPKFSTQRKSNTITLKKDPEKPNSPKCNLKNPVFVSIKKKIFHTNVHVVVQFYPWFKFYFPLFLGMVMYDNEFKTKKNKI